MKQKGFIPVTAAALVLIILTVAIIGHYQWSVHQNRVRSINDSASYSLVTSVASVQNDLEREARNSLYDAIWEAGKNADEFGGREDRQNWIENCASLDFQRRLLSLAEAAKDLPHFSFLLGRGTPSFQLQPTRGGYPCASIGMPENTVISGRLPDNSLKLDLTIKNLEVTADARYYLLRDRMESFRKNLGDIKDAWKYAEYVAAYLQAWTRKRVELSESRSRALFQIAWALHELSNFGSSDYLATSRALSNYPQSDRLLEGYSAEVIVEPIKEGEIQDLSEKADAAVRHLREAGSKLRSAVSEMRELKQFKPEKQIELISNRLIALQGRIDNSSSEDIEKEFNEIYNDARSIFTYPQRQSARVLADIGSAYQSLKIMDNRFQAMLDLMKNRGGSNPFLKQLYKDFIGSENSLGCAEQISTGLEDVFHRLESLEEKTLKLKEKLRVPGELESIFSSDFLVRFSEALNENIGEVGEILAETRDKVSEAGRRFDQAIRSRKEEIDSFYLHMESEVKDLMRRPEPNWSTRYEEYPEPDENPREPPIIRTAEKYVIRRGEGTIGGLETILEGIKAHLVLLSNFSEKFESERQELKGFKIGEDLKEILEEEIEHQTPLNVNREQFFEISLPVPLKDESGISVYHRFEIEEVQYRREDPAGWLHEQAPPTPVYLWFIGTTLHWAMWDVQIKLRKPVIEEIFDYRNQTIPRPMFEGSKSGFGYIHKPLAYRWELKKDKFSFTLVVLSLNSFEISYGDDGIV